jgi:hypothetical protein
MATEGHSLNCNCECCAEEQETQAAQAACVCPTCGQKMAGAAGKACQDQKCPKCGVALKQA